MLKAEKQAAESKKKGVDSAHLPSSLLFVAGGDRSLVTAGMVAPLL